ncbi:MAG: flagellar export protein FliJ [Treponema sp.]|jgi:flagellar FliJ protein|nr:flagellar export protein FliJ [Treponema sp.]
MKRFRFELEKVLELREYRERETEIELGKAVGILTQIEHNIAALTGERARAVEKRLASSRTTTADVLAFDRYILRLDNTKAALLDEAAKAERKVEEAREVYIEASRDRKILDNMKERRQKEYRKRMFAEETKILDDLAGGVKARKLAIGE